ncbi:MAG: hypothetical protein JWN44_1210 [Myxococcales bacterium]|nr:hypothetical protein [Myxococcales bacterium]
MAADVEVPGDDRALERALRERRFGPPEPDDATPWDFVRRWPDAVVRGRVWPIVSRLLTDADDVVRARAVEFVRDWSEGAALTVARLLEAAERHPEQFADQEVEGVALRHTLAHALSNRVDSANGARVAALLRKLAASEPIGGGAASVLGRYEPSFVAGQAVRWGDAAADWIEEATRSLALFRRDEVLPFLQATKGLDRALRERILQAVEGYIKRDDGTATALARGQGLAAPVGAAPSAAECRAAIGL